MPNLQEQYTALTSSVGLWMADRPTWIELTGVDRATFLHNLCTNDVRSLEPGQGCEAFLTTAQGKLVGHGIILCHEESLVFETVPGQAQTILGHLDRYLIREDVVLHDRSDAWSQAWLVGPEATTFLATHLKIAPPTDRLAHLAVANNSDTIHVIRDDMVGPDAFQLRGATDTIAALLSVWTEQATSCGAEALEVLRVESGRPLFGRDMTSDNLPQEIGRDAFAISFTKGCYLGQETVARIDALGHVNRRLGHVRLGGVDVPPTGIDLKKGVKTVGRVTSAVFSPKFDAPIAWAFLQRRHQNPGTKLESEFGTAEVIALPA